MRTRRVAAALVLSLAGGLAGGVVAAQTAPAPAAASPTIRPEIAPPLQAAQQALVDKQFESALQALLQAEAVAGRTPYETYLIERMRFLASAGLRDMAGALKAVEAALATEQAEPDLRAALMEQASNAAYGLKDYDKAVRWARRAIEAGIPADITRLRLAQALYLQAQYPAAAQVLDELASRQRAAGQAPGEPQLRLQASNLLKMNDEAGYARVLEDLLVVAPSPEIWADRLSRLQRQPGYDGALNLDLLRWGRRAGAFATASADTEVAETALRAGYPAEALAAIEAGFADGRLGQGADAAAHQALRDRARRATEADRGAGAPDGASLLARDPKLAFNAGWAQYTAGQQAAGIALMRQAMAKGLSPATPAGLRLALALASTGDTAQARTLLETMQATKAPDGSSDLARLAGIALGGR